MFVAVVFLLGLSLLDVAAFRVDTTAGIVVAGLILCWLAVAAKRSGAKSE